MQESAPKLAREPAADRPHTAMTTGMLFLPPAFYGEMMSEAWTAVLGSSQAVKRAAEKLLALKVRVPVTQRNLKKGPPEAVLAIMLGVHAAMRPNKRKPGGIAFSELQAASLCSGLIESLASDELKHQMRAASGWAPGEMEAVISLTFPDAIPLIRGGLHPDRYRYLLALPALIDQLRTAERAHRYRVLMALHIILVDIDVPALTRIALLTWQDELHEFFYAGIHREMLSTHLGAEGFPSDMALQLRDNLSFLLDDRLTPTPQSSPMDCLNGLAMLEMIGGNAGQYLCDIVRDYVYVRIARPLNILLVSYKGISPEGFA